MQIPLERKYNPHAKSQQTNDKMDHFSWCNEDHLEDWDVRWQGTFYRI